MSSTLVGKWLNLLLYKQVFSESIKLALITFEDI